MNDMLDSLPQPAPEGDFGAEVALSRVYAGLLRESNEKQQFQGFAWRNGRPWKRF
jgi:hypothetical protein